MSFKAILFDFDGLLVDTEWAIFEAWKSLFADHGQVLELDTYAQCVGSDFDTWSPKTHLETLSKQSYDWQTLDAERQKDIEHRLRAQGPMPNAVNLLDAVKRHQLPCAVVSSSGHNWVDPWLEELNLIDYFDTVVCRGDAPRIKPAPDLWLEAVRRLELPADSCLALEDSQNGILSAKEAGLTAWAIPNRTTKNLDFSASDAIFSSLSEVMEVLFSKID